MNYELDQEYSGIIQDELNIKKIVVDHNLTNEVELDLNITPDLKEEGQYRELVRSIQELRKKEGLTPSDKISLIIETTDTGQLLIQKFEAELKKAVLADKIEFNPNDGAETKIDNLNFKIKVQK